MKLVQSDILLALSLVVRQSLPRFVLGAALIVGGALAAPLVGLCLGRLTDAAARGDGAGAAVAGAALGALLIVGLMLGHFGNQLMMIIGERAVVSVDHELARIVQSPGGFATHERSDYADRLAMLQDETRGLTWIVSGVIEALGLFCQGLAITFLLGGIQPVLAVLPLFAVAPFFAERYAHAQDERAATGSAEPLRRARSFVELSTQPGPAMEARLYRLAGEFRRRQHDLLRQVAGTLHRADLRGALIRSAAQVLFAIGYAATLLFVVRSAARGEATLGDIVLVIVLARQTNTGIVQMLNMVSSIHQARRIGARWAWVRQAFAQDRPEAGGRPPATMGEGIRLSQVGFTYPGTGRPAFTGLDLTLKAGSVVALVGENGAGKSTLVKLLCGLYEPSAGSVLVDGTPLTSFGLSAWHARVTAGFQDYCRLEFTVRESIGVGHLPDVADLSAVTLAAARADAGDLIAKLPDGLDTVLGDSNPGGRQLSGGQWQKVALSRALMKPAPLLVVLDEPTASLDADAEHRLFLRYAEFARESSQTTGAVTVLVSHRFSTVSMADLIVVLGEGKVVESGTHAVLMEKRGMYADLFTLQARSYR